MKVHASNPLLEVEMHYGHQWLVTRDEGQNLVFLARFHNLEAVQAYREAFALSMAFAREVGRTGLG